MINVRKQWLALAFFVAGPICGTPVHGQSAQNVTVATDSAISSVVLRSVVDRSKAAIVKDVPQSQAFAIDEPSDEMLRGTSSDSTRARTKIALEFGFDTADASIFKHCPGANLPLGALSTAACPRNFVLVVSTGYSRPGGARGLGAPLPDTQPNARTMRVSVNEVKPFGAVISIYDFVLTRADTGWTILERKLLVVLH